MNFSEIKKTLNEEHQGFCGVTHWLLAIALFFILWLLPWQFANSFVQVISTNKIFLILVFLIIGGSSLLPDLDSSPLQQGGSTAVYQLGFLGYWLSIIAITISGVIYSVFHTKYDAKPKSQHRMLWHALIIPGFIMYYLFYKMPSNGSKLWIYRTDPSYYPMFILVFFIAISVYLGCSMLLYRVFKIFKHQNKTQIASLIIMIISIIYMLNTNYSNLIILGEALSLGYSFHILGDWLTEGSVPLFFPIPLPYKGLKFKKLQLWRKPRLLGRFSIKTGGIANTLINFLLAGIDLFLAWFLFLK